MTTAREQILDTTCELLELQGYHATGLNQIIKESGSPKGSLYYYFPGGKEELTAEALTRVGQVVQQRMRHYLAAVDAPAESVRQFIINIAHNVEASGYRAGGPITTVAMETASSSERLRLECQRIYASWQAEFASKLVSGGYPEAAASHLAAVIIAAIEGGIILCRSSRSPQPLLIVADAMAALIEHSSIGARTP
ncbi:MAG: TetR/AcrR family transcriptional regulator [Chloroflexota bacterium]|nr:TetR/AcrR family transcriptional regulator [Chloroflexota bacterium]